MAAYFFDSSACVKRYAIETGSGWVLGILRPSVGNTIFVARITGAETVAAIARKRKGKRLSAAEAAKAIGRFKKHFSRRYQKINITESIINEAMHYADKYELRGYDAVQMACAVEIEKRIKLTDGASLIFVSADNDLNNAVSSEGMSVENPNNYP